AMPVAGDRVDPLWTVTPEQGARAGVLRGWGDDELARLLNPLLSKPDPVLEARRKRDGMLDAVDERLNVVAADWWARWDTLATAHRQRVETATQNPDLSEEGLDKARAASVARLVA